MSKDTSSIAEEVSVGDRHHMVFNGRVATYGQKELGIRPRLVYPRFPNLAGSCPGGWSQTATSAPQSGRWLAYTYVFSPLINTSRLLPTQGTSRAKDGRNAA